MELHDYAIRELRRLDNIEVYNPDADTGIITFNVKNVFAQDAATFFNANGIAVRSGQHCAKLLNNMLDTSATIGQALSVHPMRMSIGFWMYAAEQPWKPVWMSFFGGSKKW